MPLPKVAEQAGALFREWGQLEQQAADLEQQAAKVNERIAVVRRDLLRLLGDGQVTLPLQGPPPAAPSPKVTPIVSTTPAEPSSADLSYQGSVTMLEFLVSRGGEATIRDIVAAIPAKPAATPEQHHERVRGIMRYLMNPARQYMGRGQVRGMWRITDAGRDFLQNAEPARRRAM